MKLFITLDLMQNGDTEEMVKGEELDQAIEDALEDALTGWEIQSVAVSRESFARQGKAGQEDQQKLKDQAFALSQLISEGRGGEPSRQNPAKTNTELAAWTLHLLHTYKVL